MSLMCLREFPVLVLRESFVSYCFPSLYYYIQLLSLPFLSFPLYLVTPCVFESVSPRKFVYVGILCLISRFALGLCSCQL